MSKSPASLHWSACHDSAMVALDLAVGGPKSATENGGKAFVSGEGNQNP